MMSVPPKPDYARMPCAIRSNDTFQSDLALANEAAAIRWGVRYHNRFSVCAAQGPVLAEVLVKGPVALIGEPGTDPAGLKLMWDQRPQGSALLRHPEGDLLLFAPMPVLNTRASIWIDARGPRPFFHPSSPHLRDDP